MEPFATFAETAPTEWKASARCDESSLHQLAPYIGKLKPAIAKHLINKFTNKGDIILDCFAGSGTIPLECALLGRKVLAFDCNPYAITLTRAKLEAPLSFDNAAESLAERIASAQGRPRYDTERIPGWVQKFFHPETLQNVLRFADDCIEHDDPFLLSCLLSILHHQRPGFLSYPSSHLVPYLRDRKYPRNSFPEMYVERTLPERLFAKLRRVYKTNVSMEKNDILGVGQISIADLTLHMEVDAIITSPPYMNALDYVRDNRLRMWILDRTVKNYSPEPTEKKDQFGAIIAAFARNALGRLRSGGYCILIVGETVLRKRQKSHPAEYMLEELARECPSLQVEQIIRDEIPDIRRSRRTGSATKRELVLILRK